MRSIYTALLALVAIATMVIACRKDELGATAIGPVNPKSNGGDCARNVRMDCGMLSFANEAEFQAVYDCLELAYEAHNDAFESEHAAVSEDDYDNLVDLLGFEEDQPLNEFEAGASSTSFRTSYLTALNAWMDLGEDPEQFGMMDPFTNPIMATLSNSDRAVMIGGKIHVVDAIGRPWVFCDCSTYEQFLADPSSFENSEDPCISIPKVDYPGPGNTTCRNHWKSCYWHSITSTRKVNENVSFYWGWPGAGSWTTANAEIRAFKKRNGKWKMRAMWLKVRVDGETRTTQCYSKGAFDRNKGWKRRRRLDVSRGWTEERTFFDSDVKGRFWYTGGNNDQSLVFGVGCP